AAARAGREVRRRARVLGHAGAVAADGRRARWPRGGGQRRREAREPADTTGRRAAAPPLFDRRSAAQRARFASAGHPPSAGPAPLQDPPVPDGLTANPLLTLTFFKRPC